MTDIRKAAYGSIRAGAPGLSDATCEVIANAIARKAVALFGQKQRPTEPIWRERFIADETEGPVSGILIDLSDGSQIWTGECSDALLTAAAANDERPDESGMFLMVAAKGQETRVMAAVASVDDGIALARAVAACHVKSRAEVSDDSEQNMFSLVQDVMDGMLQGVLDSLEKGEQPSVEVTRSIVLQLVKDRDELNQLRSSGTAHG